MDDSFSVRVKVETATKAVKKPVQRQTALCGLILSETGDDLSQSIEEVKIPDRLSELLLHLFEEEGIKSPTLRFSEAVCLRASTS